MKEKRTQASFSSEDAAVTLLYGLVAFGQIRLRGSTGIMPLQACLPTLPSQLLELERAVLSSTSSLRGYAKVHRSRDTSSKANRDRQNELRAGIFVEFLERVADNADPGWTRLV